MKPLLRITAVIAAHLVLVSYLGCLTQAFAKNEEIKSLQAEIIRFYEEKKDDWASYVNLKDIDGIDYVIYLDPTETLVKRGSQFQDIYDLTGGMRVTVLYRRTKKRMLATVINIDGGAYVPQ